MRLLLDTQILVWMVTGDGRLRREATKAIAAPETSLHVSAATAFEYAELQARGRLPVSENLDDLSARFEIAFEPLPADCWRLAEGLPRIHKDPVDRMAVAHAIIGGFTLATADGHMRKYPVKTLW